MLASLSIKNFSLIEDLEVSFTSGLCILTGETGSGKSILLEALSLILGQRADLSTIRPGATKCVVEATFSSLNTNTKALFDTFDLDYESETIIRRELSASGKSRAFVNDTPTTLEVLKTLGASLVDIHTQRQTLQLTDPGFYLTLIDAFANDTVILKDYKNKYDHWKSISKTLAQMHLQQQQATETLDYNKFLLKELENLPLSPGCIDDLEEEVKILRNAKGLRTALSEVVSLGYQEDLGVQDQLHAITQVLAKISPFGSAYENLHKRLSSVSIEVSDILNEAQLLGEAISDDPMRLEEIEGTLSLLHNLCQKHKVQDATGLIEKRDHLRQICSDVESVDERIQFLTNSLTHAEKDLNDAAFTLSKQREKLCKPLTQLMVSRARDLGMEHIGFRFDFQRLNTPGPKGAEDVVLMFSANKGIDFAPMAKAASGGELSRIMLVIKSILAERTQLPTLILDEIDAGVSGEMAKAMGNRMHDISQHLQVISITHLPQIAALADAHYKVYKEVVNNTTQTFLVPLDEDARIEELAEMLGGKNIKESALRHAQELRNV